MPAVPALRVKAVVREFAWSMTAMAAFFKAGMAANDYHQAVARSHR
jgi:hypothetical protein